MIKWRTHLGNEFQEQMNTWFLDHPEVSHIWNRNVLKIFHPTSQEKFIKFELSKNSILIEYGVKNVKFERKKFKNLPEQVLTIKGYWINELLKNVENSVKMPELLKHQFSVMLVNQKYGQVLTTNGNLFTG